MYAVIKPHCDNFIETQDFDVISEHATAIDAVTKIEQNPMFNWRGVKLSADSIAAFCDIHAEAYREA